MAEDYSINSIERKMTRFLRLSRSLVFFMQLKESLEFTNNNLVIFLRIDKSIYENDVFRQNYRK